MLEYYRLCFEKHGQIAPDTLKENEVWLDVGNQLRMGCFDHHHAEEYASATMAVADNTDFLEDIKKFYENGTIEVHMHEIPDMDSIASLYLINEYLTAKSKDDFVKLYGKGGTKRYFIDFVNDIDEGRKRVTGEPTLYSLMCAISHQDKSEKGKDEKEKNTEIVEKGLELIKIADRVKPDKEPIDLMVENIFDHMDEAEKEAYKKEIDIISHDKETYEEYERDNVSFEKIKLWTKQNGRYERQEQGEVDAAIWTGLMETEYGYLYAREEGKVLTVVPDSIKGKGGKTTTRVLASLDPNNNWEEYSLKSMVSLIEQMEQIEEQRVFEQEGKYRRNRDRPRVDQKLLSEPPFRVTSDPWYIKEKEDLFDAPREGSLLTYDEILQVIRNNGDTVKRSAILAISKKEEQKGKQKEEQKGKQKEERAEVKTQRLMTNAEPISQWQKTTQENIESLVKDNTHAFVFAELDASIICRSNKILEAYCSNLVGYSCQDKQMEKIMFLDYRTCIYSSLDCTIVLVATYNKKNGEKQLTSYEELPISKVLDWEKMGTFNQNTEEKQSTSDKELPSLVQDVRNIYARYRELLEIESKIGQLLNKEKKGDDIEHINDELLKLIVQWQNEEAKINNQIRRELYDFLKDKFQVETLSSIVMEKMNLLVGESRERAVSDFNQLSSWAVPGVLVATIFQMGIIPFGNFGEVSTVGSCFIWFVIYVALSVICWLLCVKYPVIKWLLKWIRRKKN